MKILLVLLLCLSSRAFAQACNSTPSVLPAATLKGKLKEMGKEIVETSGNFFWNQYADQVLERPSCQKIINDLTGAHDLIAILTSIDCENRTLKFSVPQFVSAAGSSENCGGIDNPAKPEILEAQKKLQRKRISYRTLTVQFGREQTFGAQGQAYRYNKEGKITEVYSYESKADGSYKVTCDPIDTKLNPNAENMFQMNAVAKIARLFPQQDICNRPCIAELKKFAADNAKIRTDEGPWVENGVAVSLNTFTECDAQRARAIKMGCVSPFKEDFNTRRCAVPIVRADGCTAMNGQCRVGPTPRAGKGGRTDSGAQR